MDFAAIRLFRNWVRRFDGPSRDAAVHAVQDGGYDVVMASSLTITAADAAAAAAAATAGGESAAPLGPICCFLLARGVCISPHFPCRHRHAPDDGVSPCSFGATCKQGHAKRVLLGDEAAQQAYWRAYRSSGAYEGASPAVRDATTLRAQLEPWSTASLRGRLVSVFSLPAAEAEQLGRADVMARLLAAYGTQSRPTVHVVGVPVRADLIADLLVALRGWAAAHTVNTRPSIAAASYMILRAPAEFAQKDSKNARQAAAKIVKWQALWDLAAQAIDEADAAFAANFTALAVTLGFAGSPHIDKQNTGPFYGLALGDFSGGELCVESGAFEVAHVDTHDRLGKVDGRYPHWVAPYEGTRYSLIYYQTEGGAYAPPGRAHFAEPSVASDGKGSLSALCGSASR